RLRQRDGEFGRQREGLACAKGAYRKGAAVVATNEAVACRREAPRPSVAKGCKRRFRNHSRDARLLADGAAEPTRRDGGEHRAVRALDGKRRIVRGVMQLILCVIDRRPG